MADAWDPALDPITSIHSLPLACSSALPGKELAGTVLIHRWETEANRGGRDPRPLVSKDRMWAMNYFCLAPTGSHKLGLQSNTCFFMNNLGTSNRHREATLIQAFNKHLLSDFLQASGMVGLIDLVSPTTLHWLSSWSVVISGDYKAQRTGRSQCLISCFLVIHPESSSLAQAQTLRPQTFCPATLE